MKFKKKEVEFLLPLLKNSDLRIVDREVKKNRNFSFDYDFTDYNILINYLRKNPAPAIFITDGLHHGGDMEIEGLKYPLHIYLVSKSRGSLLLYDVIYPERTSGNVSGKIIFYGENQDTTIRVRIKENKNILFDSLLSIKGTGFFDMDFSFKLKPGIHKLSIDGFNREFMVRVEKYGEILYITQKPHFNTRFIKIKSQEDSMRVVFNVAFKGKAKLEPDGYRFIILDGYTISSSEECRKLKEWIKKGNGLLVIRRRKFTPNCLHDILPFGYGTYIKEPGFLYSTNHYLYHINGKTPIEGVINAPLKRGEVIIYMKNIRGDSFPVMAGVKYGRGYILDFIGNPFYSLLFKGPYRKNFKNLIKILAEKNKEGSLRPTRRHYLKGDKVILIYSTELNYSSLSVKVDGKEYPMLYMGNYYITEIPFLEPGEYRALLHSEGKDLDSTEFTVENISIEEREFSSSRYYPELIVNYTGSKIIQSPEELSQILKRGVNMKMKIDFRNPYFFIILFILLLMDIYLRRRKGLI